MFTKIAPNRFLFSLFLISAFIGITLLNLNEADKLFAEIQKYISDSLGWLIILLANGFLVFVGKLRAETGDHAHGRARADAIGAGQAVRIPLRPFAGAGAPAESSAAGDVVKTGGPIPRRAGVPFHIRIVGEQVAVDGKGEIVSIAETHGDGLPVFAILIESSDPSAGSANTAGMAAGLGQAVE